MPATRSPFGSLKGFVNLRVTIGNILELGSEQTTHGGLHFVEQVVDDVVEANIDVIAIRRARFPATSGRTLNPTMMLLVATASATSDSEIPPVLAYGILTITPLWPSSFSFSSDD